MTAHTESHGSSSRLNWLRAGVLGANDGIVSVAALVVGVAGATSELGPIVTAGTAAIIGGAISMALGEYVSVSSQRDAEHTLVAQEERELREDPEAELAELVELYRAKGLSDETATRVARELTAKDALSAHLEVELGISRERLASPLHAAGASALAFVLGAALPFLAALLPADVRVPAIFAVVLVSLAITGAVGARLGHSPVLRPTARVVIGGVLALGATFAIGSLLGTTGVV